MELATQSGYSSDLGSEIVKAAAQGGRRWEVLLTLLPITEIIQH